MTFEEFVDKYKVFKPQMRYSLVALLSVAPAAQMWYGGGGETLEDRKTAVEAEYQSEKDKFEQSRQKAAELPALEARLSDIDAELVKAKEFLPDRVELDAILSVVGNLEKELDVTMEKFTPMAEVAGQMGLEYREVPVEIKMNGTFVNTMRFMDRLVHLQNLTHMRNIQFESKPLSAEEEKTEGPTTSARRINSTARLILFKGIGG